MIHPYCTGIHLGSSWYLGPQIENHFGSSPTPQHFSEPFAGQTGGTSSDQRRVWLPSVASHTKCPTNQLNLGSKTTSETHWIEAPILRILTNQTVVHFPEKHPLLVPAQESPFEDHPSNQEPREHPLFANVRGLHQGSKGLYHAVLLDCSANAFGRMALCSGAGHPKPPQNARRTPARGTTGSAPGPCSECVPRRVGISCVHSLGVPSTKSQDRRRTSAARHPVGRSHRDRD